MSEDLKEEMRKLKEELAGLKDQLREVAGEEHRRKRRHGFYVDIGDDFHNHVEEAMQGVAEGVRGELERSICIGPHGVRILRRGEPPRPDEEGEVDFARVAKAMNALSHEHRLRILKNLMSGGRYINELQQELADITTSTLSSHLDVLEEAGLVVQEKVRGRYLITLPGRTAYNMARHAAKFLERGREE